MLISYNWIKSYVPKLPENLSDIFNKHICEVESVEKKNNDIIYDLDILPDRAHDLLSHQGVARELASLLELEFKLPEYKVPTTTNTNLKIEIKSDKCRRYMGRIIRNVKVEPSPKWMVEYLESIGQKSINNIVDATNIVMFDSGQPIHAFSLDKMNEKIVVKNAQEGEEIELVGANVVKLKNTNMMITDGENNLAIAGVKGGAISAVSDDTRDILIETANFEPTSVRITAKSFGLLTDASKRYENDLSPNLCEFAMKEISSLIFEMFPKAQFEEIVDEYIEKRGIKKISFSTEYISRMLGIDISPIEIERILKNYNYNYTGKWEIEVPDMRLDLTGPENMVEEIGRVYGYDKIPAKIPKIDYLSEDNSVWLKMSWAKEKLIKDGYKEIMTSTFTNKGEVEVLASASDKNFLRNNLTNGVKESISFNKKNLPLSDEIKVFEIGTVFFGDKEEIHVCYGNEKNLTEITLDEFTKEEKKAHLIFPEKYSDFKPWSVYPFIKRDIAVWVPKETSPDKLISIYKELGTELLVVEPKLFDKFTKGDKTSYAFRLVFQAYNRTLTDNEVNSIVEKIESKIVDLGWEVR